MALRKKKKVVDPDDGLGIDHLDDLPPARKSSSKKRSTKKTSNKTPEPVKVKKTRRKKKNTTSVVAAALGIDRKLANEITHVAEWMRDFAQQI